LNVCVDTSFLASLYSVEVHSPKAWLRMAHKPTVWVTQLNRAEMVHAFYNQIFRSKITSAEARLAWSHFTDDCKQGVWSLVDSPDIMWETCVDLGRRYGATIGVRTLDSLHVACALDLKAQKFWTFDKRQARLAEAVGLDTSA
jgi:predicted nucleic acid-binding protein